MNGGLMMTFARESQREADGETTAKLRPFLCDLILGHSHRLQRRRFQKLFPESAGPVSSQAFCTFQNLLTIGSRLLREIIRIKSRNFSQNPLLPWELSVCWIQIAHFISRSTWTKFCQTIYVKLLQAPTTRCTVQSTTWRWTSWGTRTSPKSTYSTLRTTQVRTYDTCSLCQDDQPQNL